MKVETADVTFSSSTGKPVGVLRIYSKSPLPEDSNLFSLSDSEAAFNGEEAIQLVEGMQYEYELLASSVSNSRLRSSVTIERSRIQRNGRDVGWIKCGLFTGVMPLVLESVAGESIAVAKVEIRSSKIGYRDDYRTMLESIAQKSLDLLLNLKSPVHARLKTAASSSPDSIQQRYMFLKSALESNEFTDAINQIIANPYAQNVNEDCVRSIRKGYKGGRHFSKQLRSASRRVQLPDGNGYGSLTSLPEMVQNQTSGKRTDNLENRFVKYALTMFDDLLSAMATRLLTCEGASKTRVLREVQIQRAKIGQLLAKDIFKEISPIGLLPLGSPVLQRKSGYREVLQTWLKFELGAQLTWAGSPESFTGGMRSVSSLYEYWLLFEVAGLVSKVFNIPGIKASALIEKTSDGFSLKLKSGHELPVTQGVSYSKARNLNVLFSFNRTFSRSTHSPSQNPESNYPAPGSWTKSMRPDFTLSMWPADLSADEAELNERITHIHFDAKYRVDEIARLFVGEDDEETANKNSDETNVNRSDLLKMHAYRDAIRRTAGAYVLYPGASNQKWRGFHELLPGLGAFAIKPGKKSEGLASLEQFLRDIGEHVKSSDTERETLNRETWKILNSGKSN